jgi:UDP-glucose 4-epimerase
VSAVLVTGGAGYIGSHAVQALAAHGQQVIIYDDLSAGHAEAARRAGAGRAILVHGDILDTDHVRRAIEAHRT